jgi:hypothetical protein
MNDYSDIPKGWPRVRAALEDRVERKQAHAITAEWQASRFGPSEALSFIVDSEAHRPVDVEAL